ncbi:hypothetical protein N3K66_007682 [Trichothecium roseum]|uniref:Uncharacterized protein n=1 Tax=Trichothecium roseum TaxID=47278 RepID=A0ACC0UVY6_9HYPO|nr:hypothetical protein N3K66_007682 [Trichothecium roseum]
MDGPPALSRSCFGQTHVIVPRAEHAHTAIVLHGRGNDGKEFADEFLASTLSSGQSLPEKLPGWRWVFPTSPSIWSDVFQENLPAWFDAYSLTDTTAKQDLQVDGIRESVQHILGVIETETDILAPRTGKVYLGGISQGGAIGLWTLLTQSEPLPRLGGFFGASTWLPFASDIERLFNQRGLLRHRDSPHRSGEFDEFIATMMACRLSCDGSTGALPSTPVFIGHGIDDAYVDVESGKQAAHVLKRVGFCVEWKEYSGAEGEGHWFKIPNQIDNIHTFLTRH